MALAAVLASFPVGSRRLDLAHIEYEHAPAVGGYDELMVAWMHREIEHRNGRELGAERDPGPARVDGYVGAELGAHVKHVGVVRVLRNNVHRFGGKVG